MKNQKGVTLVYLITIIIILLILASVTFTASLNVYKNMKYETTKAELEEIQSAVVEMIEDYKLTRDSDSTISSYADYFKDKYTAKSPATLSSIDDEAIQNLITEYDLSYNEYTFYFEKDEIKTFFYLEVSINAILVDFSTGTVYDVEGFKNEDGDVFYTLKEAGGEQIINTNSSSTISVDMKSQTYQTGDISALYITLTISSEDEIYPIKNVYYSTKNDDDTYSEYSEVESYSVSDDYTTISFYIYESGEYIFKVEDTLGRTAVTDTILK